MTFTRLLICAGLYFAILFVTFFIDLFMNRKITGSIRYHDTTRGFSQNKRV